MTFSLIPAEKIAASETLLFFLSLTLVFELLKSHLNQSWGIAIIINLSLSIYLFIFTLCFFRYFHSVPQQIQYFSMTS